MLLLDDDDKRCKLVDCNKDKVVALKYCPNFCGAGDKEDAGD